MRMVFPCCVIFFFFKRGIAMLHIVAAAEKHSSCKIVFLFPSPPYCALLLNSDRTKDSPHQGAWLEQTPLVADMLNRD